MDIYNDDYILATGTANGTEQESLDKEKEIGLKQRQTFQRAVRAGVKMLFGTDAGVYPHGDNGRQFAKMVAMGHDPAPGDPGGDAQRRRGARARQRVGVIAAGRYGDIVAVARRPAARRRVARACRCGDQGRRAGERPGAQPR